MKNFVKYFATFLAMAGLIAAEIVSGTFTSAILSISTNGVSIRNFQVVDTSAAANTVILYDNDSTTSTNRVYNAYTAVTQYTTNVVMSFTNFTGVVQSYTNTVLATVNTTIPAATNQARQCSRSRCPLVAL